MGWFKDNFPGSPAARQRLFLSRGIVTYSLIAGGAVVLFSPFAKRIRKGLEDPDNPDAPFFVKKSYRLPHKTYGTSTVPTREEFMRARQEEEKNRRVDFIGPDVSEEVIRAQNR